MQRIIAENPTRTEFSMTASGAATIFSMRYISAHSPSQINKSVKKTRTSLKHKSTGKCDSPQGGSISDLFGQRNTGEVFKGKLGVNHLSRLELPLSFTMCTNSLCLVISFFMSGKTSVDEKTRDIPHRENCGCS